MLVLRDQRPSSAHELRKFESCNRGFPDDKMPCILFFPQGDAAVSSPPHASELSTTLWDQCQRIVHLFEQAWQRNERPRIEDFVPHDDSNAMVITRELVHTDIVCRLLLENKS